MKNCKQALKDFIGYWDEWHKEWYSYINTKASKSKINEWPIPQGNGGNGNSIANYFPEPYWGNPFPEKLTAVFLNLNPGLGGDGQDALSPNIANSPLYESYHRNGNVYSKTVSDLIGDTNYVTTDWFIRRRVNWLNKLIECLGRIPILPLRTIENILCADLVPWHHQQLEV